MKKHVGAIAGPLVALIVFIAALWLLHAELRQYHLRDFLDSLGRIPARRLWLAVALTVLNYVCLTGYDLLGIRYIRHPMAPGRVALASFLGYALGNNLGTLLGGSTIRYRLYSSWGLSGIEIFKLVFILAVSFWIGLCALAGIVFLAAPLQIPAKLHLPIATTFPLGVVLGRLAVGYLLLSAAKDTSSRLRTCGKGPTKKNYPWISCVMRPIRRRA